jgi:hypothetical protein
MSRSDPLDFPQTVGFWFEADLYAKLTTTWWEIFTTGVTYTYYASPNDSFSTYADVGLSFTSMRPSGLVILPSIQASCSPLKPRARPSPRS